MHLNTCMALASLLWVISAVPESDATSGVARDSTSAITRAYFVNCWTDPSAGARSEINFFNQAPLATFGHAKADFINTVSYNNNYVWENGGGVSIGDDRFQWIINKSYEDVKNVPAGSEVGRAVLAGPSAQVFALIKASLEPLYVDGIFTCRVVYTAIQVNQVVALKGPEQQSFVVGNQVGLMEPALVVEES